MEIVLLSVNGEAVPDSVRHEPGTGTRSQAVTARRSASMSDVEGRRKRSSSRWRAGRSKMSRASGQQDALDARAVDRLVGVIGYAALLAFVAFVAAGLTVCPSPGARGYLASLSKAHARARGGASKDWLWAGASSSRALPEDSWVVPFLALALFVLFVAAIPSLVSALARFPDGRYVNPRGRASQGGSLSASQSSALASCIAVEQLTEWGSVDLAIFIAGVLAILALPRRRSRATVPWGRKDAVIRQQMKWVLLPLGAFVWPSWLWTESSK